MHPGLKLSPFKMGIIKVNESLKSVDISYNLWNKTKGCLHHFTIYTSVMAFCMYLFCAMEILYTYLVLAFVSGKVIIFHNYITNVVIFKNNSLVWIARISAVTVLVTSCLRAVILFCFDLLI